MKFTYFAAALFLFMVIFSPVVLREEPGRDGAGSYAHQLGVLLAFACALLATKPWLRPARLLVLPIAVVAALAWCWLSVTWAIDPAISVRRLGLTTIAIWTVFLLVDQLGYEGTLRSLRLSLAAALTFSFLLVAFMPQVGISQVNLPGESGSVGQWRGVFLQKNFAGAFCALTTLFFLFDAKRIGLATRLAMLSASAAFLWMTGSKTSLGIVIVAASVGGLLLLYRPTYRALLIPAVMLLTVGAVLARDFYAPVFTESLYDPTALTGRGLIWIILVEYIKENPLLGAGFGSFWGIGAESPVFQYTKGWITNVFAGHNGYLDLWSQIGLPGLVLVVLASIVVPLSTLLWHRHFQRGQVALLGSVIVFCAGHNGTESSLFDRDAFLQVMLMFTVALVHHVASRRMTSTPDRVAGRLGYKSLGPRSGDGDQREPSHVRALGGGGSP